MNEPALQPVKPFKAGSIPGLTTALNKLVAPINALIRAVQKLNAARTTTGTITILATVINEDNTVTLDNVIVAGRRVSTVPPEST
jgi:hypothetical protein